MTSSLGNPLVAVWGISSALPSLSRWLDPAGAHQPGQDLYHGTGPSSIEIKLFPLLNPSEPRTLSNSQLLERQTHLRIRRFFYYCMLLHSNCAHFCASPESSSIKINCNVNCSAHNNTSVKSVKCKVHWWLLLFSLFFP